MRTAVFVIAIIISALIAVSPAHAQRGVQLDPSEDLILVNKRLGNQQWAIVLNLADQTGTGNVFNLDGSNPQFVSCEILDPPVDFFPEDLEGGVSILFDCSVATGCTTLPCDDEERWIPVGERSIVGSFFLPEGQAAAVAVRGAKQAPAATPVPRATPGAP